MLEKVLAARESRWKRRIALAGQYGKTVVTLTMNIPGSDKTRDIFVSAHERIMEGFIDFLRERKIPLIHLESRVGADGPECLMVVDLPALEMKEHCISFEGSHPLGRLIDSDVMDREGNCVGRSDMGLPPRKCLVCDKVARECMVLKRHPKEDVIRKVERMISDFLE